MTRHFPLMIACLAMAPLVAAAQGRYQPRGYPPCPTCEAGQQPSCDAPRPTCEAPPPCKPPCNPPQQPVMMQQPGVFVQPPASGTVQGPVEQSGIEGATVTFPELSLRMPSIRFPAKSRSRQNARMLLDQQYAPYVESPPVATMPASAAPVAAAPAAQPMMAAAPPMQMMMAPAAPQMQMMMMPQQMMMAPMQMAPQQYYTPQPAPQQNPVQPMQAPQPEPENAPPPYRTPAPSCDARGNPMAMNATEAQIRQLELAEQQLLQRMEVLRRQLDQVEVSRRVPTPSPDLGARAIQLPAAQPLRATGIQPVQPVSQPPQRSIAHPLQPAANIYNERPASYISEPRPLPQYQQPQQQYVQPQYSQPQPVYYQQQPVYSQQSQVIREPQATITGVRAR